MPTRSLEEEKKIENFDLIHNQKENFNFGEIMIIEINPFDGKALGSFPGSMGLFDLEKDERLIKEGELEVRVREEEMKENELKYKLNDSWKSILKGCI